MCPAHFIWLFSVLPTKFQFLLLDLSFSFPCMFALITMLNNARPQPVSHVEYTLPWFRDSTKHGGVAAMDLLCGLSARCVHVLICFILLICLETNVLLVTGRCYRCQCGRTGSSPWLTSIPVTVKRSGSQTWWCRYSGCCSITRWSLSTEAGECGSIPSLYSTPR